MALGGIGSVRISINDKVRTGTISGSEVDVFLAGFDAEFNEFGNIKSLNIEDFISPAYKEAIEDGVQVPDAPKYQPSKVIDAMRRTASYGEFVFCVVSQEVFEKFTRTGFFTPLEKSFGVTRWREREQIISSGSADLEPKDYWFFARRGDFSFVPREDLVARRNGAGDFTVTLETSLIEQFGEDGTLSKPVSYAGKIKGERAPKAHRLFSRLSLGKKAPLSDSKSEVSQFDYNRISQPDLQSVEVRSGEIFEDVFGRPATRPTIIGNDWSLSSSDPLTVGAESLAGARLVGQNLVLGPAPAKRKDIKPLSGRIEESQWEGTDVRDVCAYKEFDDLNGFAVRGVFGIPKNADQETPLYIMSYKSENQPVAEDGYGFAVMQGEENNVYITDGKTIGPDTDPEEWPLAVGSQQIEAGETYEFLAVYGKAEGETARNAIELSVWLWPDEGIRSQEPTAEEGPKVPSNIRTSNVGNRNALSVGINNDGVDKKGYWYFPKISVENIDEVYSQAIMEMDVSGQRGEMNLITTARGQGGNDEGRTSYGHSMYLWDYQREKWDLLERVDYEAYKPYTQNVSINLLPEYVQNGNVNILATTNYRHLQSLKDPTESRLSIDYAYGRSVPVNRKTYGKTDFYFRQKPDKSKNDRGFTSFRPSQEVEFIIEDIGALNVLGVDSSEDGTFNAPIEEIISVKVLDENDNEIVELEPKTEYRYFWNNEALRGSMREEIALVIDSLFAQNQSKLKVTARVHSMTRLLNEYFQSDDQRKIDGDLLAMHKQSVFVDAYIKHRGSATGLEEDVRRWIYDHDGEEMNVSDLVSFLGNRGAEDILLYDGSNESDAASLTARRIDKNGNEQKESSFTLLQKEVTETFVPGTIRIISL